MKKGARQSISPNQWLCSILEALYMYHGKMDSPPMPFSIARSAVFRHGRAICMYYSETEDDRQCSMRKIDEVNLKLSRVTDFLFEENDQREKHDVCRCISTSKPVIEMIGDDETNLDPTETAKARDVSIAYFSSAADLCEYIKSSAFSGLVQHVSADCGPDLCETRYRMLKVTWHRQTISTEMKINIHRASSNNPVHEKFCTFDAPMHLVETYATCSKNLSSKISTLIATIKKVVNAYIPVSSEIWNGDFYLNHSRSGILRFEFTSFVQIASKHHFSSLSTVEQLIPRAAPIQRSILYLLRPQTAASTKKIPHLSTNFGQSTDEAIRPQSSGSRVNWDKIDGVSTQNTPPRAEISKSSKLVPVSISSLLLPRNTKLSADNSKSDNDATLDEDKFSSDHVRSTTESFAKFRSEQRKTSLKSRFVRRLSSLKKCDAVEMIKDSASLESMFQVKVKNVKTITPKQQIFCPQCGVEAEFQRCHTIPVDVLLNALQVRAKIYTIENPNLHVGEGYLPLWEIDPRIAQLYTCVALFDETIADLIQVSGPGSRAKTISLSEWLAFCRKTKMYDKLPITKHEVIQIFEDANRCDFLSDDNQFEMTIEEFCQALIFVAQKTGYLHCIDRLNAPLSWKLLPNGDVVHCVINMLDHLDIQGNPDFVLASFVAEGPKSYILQKLKVRDMSRKNWIATNEIPLLEKIRRENFLSKVSEIVSPNSAVSGKSLLQAARVKLKAVDLISQFADMIVTLFYVHYLTPFETGTKEFRAVETLLTCKEFMACELRICEKCILHILGTFVTDNITGMSLQQQAERSHSPTSPSRSPSMSPSHFQRESFSPAINGGSPVPRLNLSPNALRLRIFHAQEKEKPVDVCDLESPINDEESSQGISHPSNKFKMASPISKRVDLKARRELLLESLLFNEHDSKMARNELQQAIAGNL